MSERELNRIEVLSEVETGRLRVEDAVAEAHGREHEPACPALAAP